MGRRPSPGLNPPKQGDVILNLPRFRRRGNPALQDWEEVRGDLVANAIWEDGVTLEAVMDKLPEAVRILRERPEYIIERCMPIEI